MFATNQAVRAGAVVTALVSTGVTCPARAAEPYIQPTSAAPAARAPIAQAPTGQAPTGQAPTGQAPTGQAPTGQAPIAQARTDAPTTNEPPMVEMRAQTGFQLSGSSWRTDFAAWGHVRGGFRFWQTLGVYGGAQLGYATVDTRFLTMFTLGISGYLPEIGGRVKPFARAAFIHQHEESLSVIANDFGSALLGIGDGIRHRAGADFALGADIRVWTSRSRTVHLFLSPEATLKWFPDQVGPPLYPGGAVGFGVNYGF